MARGVAVALAVCVLSSCSRPDATGRADSTAIPGTAATTRTPPPPAEPDSDVILITGPTLVAVVPHTSGYLDSNVTDGSDLATVLDDFSFYLGVTDSAFAARGIRRLLRLGAVVKWTRAGRRDSLVLNPDSGVAYLFWGPTGPTVRRGVMTDVDLLEFVGDTGRGARSDSS